MCVCERGVGWGSGGLEDSRSSKLVLLGEFV